VRQPKSKPHQVGMQVSHCLDTKIPQESSLCRVAEILGRNPEGAGQAKRMRGAGGASHAEVVRAYIQAQEKEDQRLEQLNLFE